MAVTGKIIEINKNSVVIVPDVHGSCFGCMKQECKTPGGTLLAENPHKLTLMKGQLVELRCIGGLSLFVQAMIAILPPAAGFISGYFLCSLIFPDAGEGACAGLGLIFLFAAAFVVYLVLKKKPLREGIHTVTKIL